MLKKRSVTTLAIITSVIVLVFTAQTTFAGSISFSFGKPVGGNYRERNYEGNKRLTSEKRDGYRLNDWIERGSSSVTDSPKYKGGVRLATWADRYDDEYDYGLASAVYRLNVPHRARSVKIKIKYDGSHGRYSDDDNIAGRLWIKTGGRYSDYGRDDEALYGDTFILRENRHKEEITISTDEHVINGVMEIHIIAEGGQLIDVDYIEVETYTAFPDVRIITKEYKTSRPWYNNTYLYFYTGPVYNFGRGHYVKYTYSNSRHLFEIRRQYSGYLRKYHGSHPQIKLQWSGSRDFPKFREKGMNRVWVDKWTPDHERTRKSYAIASKRSRKPVESRGIRDQVRRVITGRRNPAPKRVEKYERKQEKEEVKSQKKENRGDDREDRRSRLRNR